MEFPECSICFQPYNEEEQIPRVLSCGHSPCQSCINELPRHWNGSQLPNSASRDCLIRCPECNQWVKLPLQGSTGLPKNIQLLRVVQSLGGLPSKQGNPGKDSAKRSFDSAGGAAQEDCSIEIQETTLFKKLTVSDKRTVLNGQISSNVKNFVPGVSLRGLDADWTNWVIPQAAIRVEKPLVESEENPLLIGKMIISHKTLSKEQWVSLMPVGTNRAACPSASLSVAGRNGIKTNPYAGDILRVLQSLSEKENTELQILARLSLLNRRVCRLYGFWMSSEGQVFLACEKSNNNVSQTWNALISGSIQTRLRSPTMEGLSPKSRRWQSSEALKNFAKIAMELCEIVIGLHSQAVVCGHLGPECLDFDELGHPFMDLNQALWTRKRLKHFMKNYVVGTTSNKPECILNPITMPWLCLSPEVLFILYKNERTYKSSNDNISGDALESVSETAVPPCFKSDVWSLGCLFVMLLLGECPLSDFSFAEFLNTLVMERNKLEVWLEERICSEVLPCSTEVPLGSQFEQFKHLLCTCFEYEPRCRPDVADLWRCLNDWFTYAGQFCKDVDSFNQPDKDCWCLVLGESLPALAQEIESHVEEEEASAKLGTKHMLTSKLRNYESSQGNRIATQRSGEGVGGVKEEEELQSQDLKVATLEGHLGSVTALAVYGEFLLSSSFDKTICIWSLQGNSHLQTLRGHEHRILALAVDVKASVCFSGDYGGCIFVWAVGSITKQEPVMTWYEHRDWRYSGVHSLAVSEDGYLYSGSGDRTIKVWSLQDFNLITTMEGHKSVVSALLINEGLLYSGSWDGTIRLWWRADHSPLVALGDNAPTYVRPVHALSMCDDILIVAYDNGCIQVWKDGILLKSQEVHNGSILSLDVQHEWIFTGGWDKTIKAFSAHALADGSGPKLVIDCSSVVTSLLCKQGKLFAGLADCVIKVTKCLVEPRSIPQLPETFESGYGDLKASKAIARHLGVTIHSGRRCCQTALTSIIEAIEKVVVLGHTQPVYCEETQVGYWVCRPGL